MDEAKNKIKRIIAEAMGDGESAERTLARIAIDATVHIYVHGDEPEPPRRVHYLKPPPTT